MEELRFAFRTLRKSPGFTLTAIATLALAIAANTTMFSVLNAVLLRPFPYPSPEQLTMLWTESPSLREGRTGYRSVEDWRSGNRSFSDIAAFDGAAVTLTSEDRTERIAVTRVSPAFFSLLGVQPLHGRIFSAEEADQRRNVAMISHRFWQTRFGGSRDAIGASITLDGVPSEIIGIMPEEVGFLGANAAVWQPHTLFPDWAAQREARGPGPWFVVGRLRPNVTQDQAQAEMSTLASRFDEQLAPGARNRGIRVVPFSQFVVGSRSRLALWLLGGAVFCILLIAAANVASISLARAVGRAREMAIRTALGASPARIARQLLAESATLAAVSGIIGTLLAPAAIGMVRTMGPANLARLNEAGLDLRVLGWALVISFLTAVLIGIAPAILTSRRDLRRAVEDGGRSLSGGVAARGVRRALVVGEFAIAIVLLVGAGLLIRSWWFIESVDPGFRTEQVLSMQLSTTAFTSIAQRTSFYGLVLEQIESLPGVESAGIIGDLFISNSAEQILTTEVDDRAVSERVQFRRDEASPALFTTIGAPLLRGRFFTAEDGPDSPRVAIINETMARRLWPGGDPVGKRFKLGPREVERPWITVVGVIGDMRRQGPEREPFPQMFEPLAQDPSRLATVYVRTSLQDPMALIGTLQAAVRRVDKQVPVYGVTTLENRFGDFTAERRFQTSLVIGFSVIALLLAGIGIYGVIQYSVATRTQEIGIRMAVGARSGDIFGMLIREGLRLSLAGLAIGLAGAFLLARVGATLLFGVGATDPLTFMAVSLLLTAVAAAACYFPARRAMKVDPLIALQRH